MAEPIRTRPSRLLAGLGAAGYAVFACSLVVSLGIMASGRTLFSSDRAVRGSAPSTDYYPLRGTEPPAPPAWSQRHSVQGPRVRLLRNTARGQAAVKLQSLLHVRRGLDRIEARLSDVDPRSTAARLSDAAALGHGSPQSRSSTSETDATTTRLAPQVPSAAATAVAATTAAVAGGALRVADIIRPEDWQFTEVKVPMTIGNTTSSRALVGTQQITVRGKPLGSDPSAADAIPPPAVPSFGIAVLAPVASMANASVINVTISVPEQQPDAA